MFCSKLFANLFEKKCILGGNNYGGSNYGGNNYGGKKKGGMGKTLKKAAVIGAVAYGSYQLGKMSGNFGRYHHGGQWGYNDYNR